MRQLTRITLVFIALLIAAPVSAADFEKGLSAYKSGDYATALRRWTPLAKQGDAGLSENAKKKRIARMAREEKVRIARMAREEKARIARMAREEKARIARIARIAREKEEVKRAHKAAERGDVIAQYNLGKMYIEGKGVNQDSREASVWIRKAAEKGNANAQELLGVMYRDGEGVVQDETAAHVWFSIAAANGASGAKWKRDAAAIRQSSLQREKVTERAKRCMASRYTDCGVEAKAWWDKALQRGKRCLASDFKQCN